MRLSTLVIAFVGTAAIGASSAVAVPIFHEDFESYTENSDIGGQGSWTSYYAVANPVVVAPGGSKALEVTSAATAGGQDRGAVAAFTHLTTGRYALTFDFYYPSTTTEGVLAVGWDNESTPAEPQMSTQYGFRRNSSVANVYEDAHGTGTPVPLVFDTWVEAKTIIDLDTNTASLYYDDTLISTHPYSGDATSTPPALDSFWFYAFGGSEALSGPVYMDNINVDIAPPDAVPEPASLGLLTAGSLLMLARRRRTRA